MGNKRSERKKRKKKIWPKILAGLVALFLVTVAMGYFYVTSMLGKMDKIDINTSNLGINESISGKYPDIRNIALFGVDSTDGGHGRSDSMMVLTIDKKNKKIKSTSLMRDSYVKIDGRAELDKLNHAYAYGGPELAIKTINENFGLNIKEFATVNFTSLPKIIDTLGGIELEVDSEELKYINFYINELNGLNKTSVSNINSTGVQKLNGTQAMAYCRIRYTSGGDYKRTERHREVLEKLFEELMKTSVTKYPTILNQVMPMVQTNMSTNDILALGTDVVGMGGKIEQDRYPKDEDSKEIKVNKLYYLQFDETATKEKMHKWIFEDIK